MLPLAHFNKTAIVTVGGRCDHGSTTLETVGGAAGGAKGEVVGWRWAALPLNAMNDPNWINVSVYMMTLQSTSWHCDLSQSSLLSAERRYTSGNLR